MPEAEKLGIRALAARKGGGRYAPQSVAGNVSLLNVGAPAADCNHRLVKHRRRADLGGITGTQPQAPVAEGWQPPPATDTGEIPCSQPIPVAPWRPTIGCAPRPPSFRTRRSVSKPPPKPGSSAPTSSIVSTTRAGRARPPVTDGVRRRPRGIWLAAAVGAVVGIVVYGLSGGWRVFDLSQPTATVDLIFHLAAGALLFAGGALLRRRPTS
jgi:hypothetical protein